MVLYLAQTMKSFPILVRVSIMQTAFNPDAVDAKIYCVNNTGKKFTLSSRSESFMTIDEKEGETVSLGSPGKTITLEAGESVLIADVLGWEWDGHVGIELEFRENGAGEIIRKSYDFKRTVGDFYWEGKTGRLINPL